MSLPVELKSQYAEQGWTVLPEVLTDAQLREARAVVDDLVERSREVTASDDVYDLDHGHTSEMPRVRRLKDPVWKHAFFAELMRSDRILDAVADVIGASFRFHSSKINLKAGDGGSGIEWHQDFAFFPHTNDDLVACGIALDDSDEDNGCLLAVPGSHRGPVLDHHQGDAFVGAVPGDHPAITNATISAVPVPAGGMSLHHVRLLHGSARNTSGRQRRMLFFQFVAADAFPLSYAPLIDVPPLTAFAQLVVRGSPSTSARLVDLNVELPRLGPSYGSIYDVQEQLATRAFDRTAVTPERT